MSDPGGRRSASTETTRVAVAGVIGVVAAAVFEVVSPWQLAAIGGWDVAALVLLAWIWVRVGRLDAAGTRRESSREDSGRNATRVALVAASVASLIGVLFAFVKAKAAAGAGAATLTGAALLTVACSWFLVHSLFTLRYAHLYYEGEEGGIDFKSDEYQPTYADFAYLAFTVGMTFQVSDTDIQSADIRRTVLRQSLLSYLFGTVVVASTINVVAGLIR